MITHKLEKMDFARRGPTQTVSVVQDDKYSRNLEFTLMENGEAWNRPETLSVVVRYRKPDGTGGSYDTLPNGNAACSVVGNVATVALAPQVCTVPGTVRLVVALVSGTTELHTFMVNIDVQANPGLQVSSEDYYKVSGALADSGWTPNMYLGTDADGNVITVESPTGGGATVDEVLDAIPQATAVSIVRDGQTITLTTTLEDGAAPTSVVTLDDNDYPTLIVTDGVECAVSWEGF